METSLPQKMATFMRLVTPIPISNLLMQPILWRFVGFASSVVALLCFALGSSFKHLFGEWNLLKICLYGLVSFLICGFMLFSKEWRLSRSLLFKTHLGFLVLMLVSVYSFFYDKAMNGKPDVLSLISCGAFALMSFCLSRLIELGFEVDLLNFFLGCLTVQLMKINLMLAFVGAGFGYSLIFLRSSLDTQQQIETASVTDHMVLEIDGTNSVDDHNDEFYSDFGSHHRQLQSLHRRTYNGYYWRKYGQKQVNGSENPKSYYKCTYPTWPTKKKVERSLEGPNVEIVYKGAHNHPKPQLRNSSISMGDDNLEQSLRKNKLESDKFDEDESDYGYYGRKYGQKQVNGSKNSKSYHKCTYPTWPTKKKAERSLEGQIVEIVCKGAHNHPKPQLRNSSMSMGDDNLEQSLRKNKLESDKFDEDESDAIRRDSEIHSVTVGEREFRVVVQTISDLDIIDDGYRWRKYGQKVMKGNQNPSLWLGCPVKKYVQRASNDPRTLITTYEGKHNHGIPATRGSGSHSVNRVLPNDCTSTNNATTA